MTKVVIKMRDNITRGVRTKNMVTTNDTTFEIINNNAVLNKTVEFCVDGKFVETGTITVNVPFKLKDEDVDVVHKIIESIKTDKRCAYIDFESNPPKHKSRTNYTQVRIEEFDTDSGGNDVLLNASKYTLKKVSPYLAVLGGIYMPAFSEYANLDYLKAI